jgi:sigma-54 specific flagellar transcriptional regulator A
MDETKDFKGLVKALEISLITEALEKKNQNRAEAAKYLGIKRTTLVEKMRRFGFPLMQPFGRKPTQC